MMQGCLGVLKIAIFEGSGFLGLYIYHTNQDAGRTHHTLDPMGMSPPTPKKTQLYINVLIIPTTMELPPTSLLPE